MTLDLSQLRRLAMFASVVENGSFAAAAASLGTNRPSVSEQVRLLEDSIGARLLQRTTRRLTLTAEGEAVYPEAAAILGSLSTVLDIAGRDRPAGRIRMTAPQDLANVWLLPVLRDFTDKYPEITFDLVLSDTALDLISERLDLAIRGMASGQDSTLITRPLFEESLVPMASPSYLEKFGVPKTLKDVEQHRWILMRQTSKNGRIRLRKSKQRATLTPRDAHLCDTPMALRRMLEEGFGIGLELPSMVKDKLADGRLISVLPGWQSEHFTFTILYPSRHHLPARIKLLIDHLLAHTRNGEGGAPWPG